MVWWEVMDDPENALHPSLQPPPLPHPFRVSPSPAGGDGGSTPLDVRDVELRVSVFEMFSLRGKASESSV